MNATQAVQEAKDRCNENRGIGAFTIAMKDGREYSIMSYIECGHGEAAADIHLIRVSAAGDIIEQRPARNIEGEVDRVESCLDESGAAYC